ncbi:uncharacterized protein VP01_225g9 [Puccinia sorghi]|uniref:Helicase ATP-binding domain-containing protein n=1 Tax=Puccinia sorghi TaxID=27349 RepID=A0A0L6V896_9BASI|nr:uncharacterized protein VP01_225g9 [Puccinia sorghi]
MRRGPRARKLLKLEMVGIQLSSKVKEANDDELKEIKKKLMEKYDQEAKLLPVNLTGKKITGIVVENLMVGCTAINLTKPTFTTEACQESQAGCYNFVYLSPQIFLDNEAFGDVYISPEFQSKMVLVVVNEAHMIYAWGLVERGMKKLKTILLKENNTPLLLMFTTCRPAAVEAIKKNPKLLNTHIDPCQYITKVYRSKDLTPNQLVPCLIYYDTFHFKLQVLEYLDQAQETPNYHLTTHTPMQHHLLLLFSITGSITGC